VSFSWSVLVAGADGAGVTIHWSGDASRFWMLTEFKPILTLPALQSLTVSCAVLGDDLADGLAGFASTTPLTRASTRPSRQTAGSNDGRFSQRTGLTRPSRLDPRGPAGRVPSVRPVTAV
jgi:hypothetical protein